MSRVKKPKPTLDSIFFVTLEQRLVRFLMTESSTSFTHRVLASKLKGVRGLGGAEGIQKILQDLSDLGFIQFIDNNRAIVVNNDHPTIKMLKKFSTVCDLEGLVDLLSPIAFKIILHGSRAKGKDRSDSDYNLFIVSDEKEQATEFVTKHPLGKRMQFLIWARDDYTLIEKKDSDLSKKLTGGILLWGPDW